MFRVDLLSITVFSRVKSTADRLISLSAVIGAIGLVLEVVIILVDVVGRFFGQPLTGAQDMSTMTLVIVIFGGMAMCDRLGSHVAVDIFEKNFSRHVNHWLDVFSALLGAVIFAFIAWTVYESSVFSQMLNLSTNIIKLPKAWFQWLIVAFSVLTAVAMLLRGISLALTSAEQLAEHEQKAAM